MENNNQLVMKNSDQEFSLLIKEGYLASSSIGHGLTALRKAGTHAKGEYYQAFFQLSIGLERLMKLIIIQYYRGTNNAFPNNKILKSYGHDLSNLYQTIVKWKINQKTILHTEKISLKILEFLSEFAKTTRYYNLDTLTGRQQYTDPLIQWRAIQGLIIQKHPKRRRKSKLKDTLINLLNERSYVIVYNEKNELFSNVGELFQQIELDEYTQSYSVYYTLLLIENLATILENIEFNYNLYPCLRDFFYYFKSNGLTKYEIRRKKNWIYY